MQNIAIAKEGDEHQERCLFFLFRINRFELLNKSHVPSAGFLGWSMAHPDHPLATPLTVCHQMHFQIWVFKTLFQLCQHQL